MLKEQIIYDKFQLLFSVEQVKWYIAVSVIVLDNVMLQIFLMKLSVMIYDATVRCPLIADIYNIIQNVPNKHTQSGYS
jgi:hypothetical protein